MMIPKRRLLTLIFACLCFKKSFLIKIIIIIIMIMIIIIAFLAFLSALSNYSFNRENVSRLLSVSVSLDLTRSLLFSIEFFFLFLPSRL